MDIFKQMLRESSVSPFGQWEVEKAKIASDPRFNVLALEKEKISAFNSYCKVRSQELQQESKQKTIAISQIYQDFLDQNVTSKTLWPEIVRKVKKQFTGKMDIRDCEKRFKQYISDLKNGVTQRKDKEIYSSVCLF